MEYEQIADSCVSVAGEFYERAKELHPDSLAHKSNLRYVERMNKAAEIVRAFEALCEVGIIQYGADPETRIYSVWGFDGWEHNEDLLTAIQSIKAE